MPSVTNKIVTFLRGPRGQHLVSKIRGYAERPENRRRLARLRERLAAQRRPAPPG